MMTDPLDALGATVLLFGAAVLALGGYARWLLNHASEEDIPDEKV